MPAQFIDGGKVASPTTCAPGLKGVEAPCLVPVREGRSQSLTTLPRRASTASVLTVDLHDTLSDSEGHGRYPRRVLSSGTGCSLSFLQQELGYPQSARGPSGVDRYRHRRRSLLETTLEKTTSTTTHTSGQTSLVPNLRDGDWPLARPEPESEWHVDAHEKSAVSRSSSSPRRGRALDLDENFMTYRMASVTGYSRDTDGVVYYEVIVRSTAHGPLSAYTVRRRYSEFRTLHVALSHVMPVSPHPLAAVTAVATSCDNARDDDHADVVKLHVALTEGPLARDRVALPPLPDQGGMWSYLHFDSVPLLERRAAYFHAMLVAAQRHPAACASRLVNDFVGTPPDLVAMHSSVETSYVSLNRFAAPKLSFEIEIQERKEKAQSIQRRRSVLRCQSFTGSLETNGQWA